MKHRFIALAAAALIAVCGCSPTALVRKMAPDDVQAASRKAISDLRAHRFGALDASLVEELRGQNHEADFERMAAVIPDEEPVSSRPVGYLLTAGPGWRRYDVSYELQFSKGWVLVRFSWMRPKGGLRISDFHVAAMARSLEEVNAFTFRGKGPLHYGVLVLGALALAISVTALVACYRTPELKRKWLWIIFIAVGFGSLSINWTTGAWQIGLLNVQLLSFSAFAPFGSPWTVAVSVPVGAVVFLDRARKLRMEREAAARMPPVL